MFASWRCWFYKINWTSCLGELPLSWEGRASPGAQLKLGWVELEHETVSLQLSILNIVSCSILKYFLPIKQFLWPSKFLKALWNSVGNEELPFPRLLREEKQQSALLSAGLLCARHCAKQFTHMIPHVYHNPTRYTGSPPYW